MIFVHCVSFQQGGSPSKCLLRDCEIFVNLRFQLYSQAYILAELLHWSGILSLISCGIVQAHYAFRNISSESLTTVQYFIKMVASVSDCIIFLYLGMAFFDHHEWNTAFVLSTIVIITVVRFSAANRLIGEVVQSRRRPLLGPSP